MYEITIGKPINGAEYLPQIDRNEVDADFIHAVSESSEDVYVISHRETNVGLALLEGGKHAFLYVYIFPDSRRRGFGKAAVLQLERELDRYDPVDIFTNYRADNPIADAFAKNCGYKKRYSSAYMVYSGPGFERESVLVRQYQDQDYYEAHSFYAEAFHLMRLRTGLFPDSVSNPASEEERKYWADTTMERLVYLDGDEIIGYAHIEGSEIGSISVKPDRQGQGVGKKFLKHIVNTLLDAGYTSISLYCVVGNDRARHVYDTLGFIQEYCVDFAKKKMQ